MLSSTAVPPVNGTRVINGVWGFSKDGRFCAHRQSRQRIFWAECAGRARKIEHHLSPSRFMKKKEIAVSACIYVYTAIHIYICESFSSSDKAYVKRCALKFLWEICEANFPWSTLSLWRHLWETWHPIKETLIPERFTIVFRGNALRVFSRPLGVR